MKIQYNNETKEVQEQFGGFRAFGKNFYPVIGSNNQLRAAGEIMAEAIEMSPEEKTLFVDAFAHLSDADKEYIASQEAYKA